MFQEGYLSAGNTADLHGLYLHVYIKAPSLTSSKDLYTYV